ncbi:hypothetical protein ABT369_26160 [Dactylosporangium sp. NPDC000244]|uniref:hypothetical protein n=1 Tax=Dactylosporangium sp. NPDC000244 TaxID=3154365 RepID=UPI00331AC82B
MRYLRGLLAAAVVAGAGGLCFWAGHIGASSWWRGAATVVIGLVAWLILTFVVGVIVTGDGEAGCVMYFPALLLVGALIWLVAIDIEVRTGQWQAVTVMDTRCVSTDNGCAWQYRVSDDKTERDLGWIPCGDRGLGPGDHTRLHVDPAGKHRSSLEPCAFTSPGWTTGLRVVEGLWVLTMVAAFGAAVFAEDFG